MAVFTWVHKLMWNVILKQLPMMRVLAASKPPNEILDAKALLRLTVQQTSLHKYFTCNKNDEIDERDSEGHVIKGQRNITDESAIHLNYCTNKHY